MHTFNYGFEIKTKNGSYYPIHLDSGNLCLLLDCFLGKMQKSNVVNCYARKSQFKGVEYKIIFASDSKLSNIDRTYSILINPNWSVQIQDHWYSASLSSMDSNIRTEVLPDAGEYINGIIFKDILSKMKPTDLAVENPIFIKDEWVCIRKIEDFVLID